MILKKIQHPSTIEEIQLSFFSDYAEIVKSKNDDTLYIVTKDGVGIAIPFTKDNITNILYNLSYKNTNKIPSQKSVNNIWALINALAQECTDYRHIAKLICQNENGIFFDIGVKESILNVTSDTARTVKRKECEVLFLKNEPYDYIPDIVYEAYKGDFVNIMNKFFNVNKGDLILLCVYIISLFIPNINHPLLILEGEYGAAKSTTLRMISRIINPNNGDVSTLPSKAEELAVLLHNNYFTAFDNVSYISKDISDLLCQAVTGGSYTKRKLYTDNKTESLNIHKPVALNGLNLNITYSDLMDRAIYVELKRISAEQRLTEEQVWEKFYEMYPTILTSVCFILNGALKIRKTATFSKLPRLADFASWGYCIAESINEGWGNLFLKQYQYNIDIARKTVISNNPLLNTLSIFMDDKEEWTGSMTSLLKELKNIFFKESIATRLPPSFPTTPNTLSRKLNTLQNDLAVLKIKIEIGRGTKRYICIYKDN